MLFAFLKISCLIIEYLPVENWISKDISKSEMIFAVPELNKNSTNAARDMLKYI